MKKRDGVLPASFRDPSGFVFRRDGVLYRQIEAAGLEDYEALMSSGLYDELA
ncbi:SAM-dependent methyltransferase, partial [bacterium]|nr:SAM-dependent methyltransferase [bacterium]